MACRRRKKQSGRRLLKGKEGGGSARWLNGFPSSPSSGFRTFLFLKVSDERERPLRSRASLAAKATHPPAPPRSQSGSASDSRARARSCLTFHTREECVCLPANLPPAPAGRVCALSLLPISIRMTFRLRGGRELRHLTADVSSGLRRWVDRMARSKISRGRREGEAGFFHWEARKTRWK